MEDELGDDGECAAAVSDAGAALPTCLASRGELQVSIDDDDEMAEVYDMMLPTTRLVSLWTKLNCTSLTKSPRVYGGHVIVGKP